MTRFNPDRMLKASVLKEATGGLHNRVEVDYCPQCGGSLSPERLSAMTCSRGHDLYQVGIYTKFFREKTAKKRGELIAHGYTLYDGFHTHNQEMKNS